MSTTANLQLCLRRLAKPVVLFCLIAVASPGSARDASTPDWPCVQRKVENVTSMQVWQGPAVDTMTDWQKEPDIPALVARLASRRTSLNEAEKAAQGFADQQPYAARARRLTLLFAGLFDTLQQQRRTVIGRLESYRRAQGQRALELERQGVVIADLEERSATDPAVAGALAEAQERFDMAQRIFQERQDSIPIACELPVRIDARAFALGKAIFDLMPAAATSMAPPAP